MSGVWEIVVVGIIVAGAATWAGLSLWRTTKKKQICSSCASSGGCPLSDGGTVQPLSTECGVPEPVDPPAS